MQVIKHGNTYKEVECPKCGAVLSYCKADVKKHDICDEYFGIWHSYYEESIECLECNKKIILYSFTG